MFLAWCKWGDCNVVKRRKVLKKAAYVLLNAGNEFNPESIYNYLKSNNGGIEYCSIKSIYNYLDRMAKLFDKANISI